MRYQLYIKHVTTHAMLGAGTELCYFITDTQTSKRGDYRVVDTIEEMITRTIPSYWEHNIRYSKDIIDEFDKVSEADTLSELFEQVPWLFL